MLRLNAMKMLLYYWIMQYSDCVKVISSTSFVEKIKEGLKKGLECYE